jgi:hypothetical protein
MGEPNDYDYGTGTEDYLQIIQLLQPDGTRARWNDLPNATSAENTYRPKVYVLEVDKGEVKVGKDRNGDTFGLKNVDFQKYLSETVLSIDTIANA